MGGAMNWRQRLGAFIGGFDAGQHHRRLRGFRATRAHVNALIAAAGPDITARARAFASSGKRPAWVCAICSTMAPDSNSARSPCS